MVEVDIKWSHKIPGKEVAEVWARVKFDATGDRVYSYDLELKTILDLVAMPHHPGDEAVTVQKYLMNQGQPDNYASLWGYSDVGADTKYTGSMWANIHALGQ